MCNVKDKVTYFLLRGKRKPKYIRVDRCLIPLIKTFEVNKVYESVACCCGHGKYKTSFLVRRRKNPDKVMDIFSGVKFPIKRNYYKRNKGTKLFFFIPEVEDFWEENRKNIEKDVVKYFLERSQKEGEDYFR